MRPYVTMIRRWTDFYIVAVNKESSWRGTKFRLRLQEMPYIGHVPTTKELKLDPHKIQAIIDFETPKDVAGIHRHLGLVNYLAKFINN